MRKLVLAAVLGLLIATAVPAGVSAAPQAHARRFVGTYEFFLRIPPDKWYEDGLMTLRSDGTGAFHGPGENRTRLVWSNLINAITIRFKVDGHAFQMYGQKTPPGISRRSAPGTFSIPGAYWYAVRTT